MMLVQIMAPHFTAGVLVDEDNEIVIATAPIVKYMKGWTLSKVRDYCGRKGWSSLTLGSATHGQ